MRRLQVIHLGLIGYGEAHKLQLRLVEERAAEKITDTLLLLEHPHVITLGRRMKEYGEEIQGIPIYRVERGGEATYHGPGQLVGYPIINLNSLGLGIKEYVWKIEEALIRAVGEYGVKARRREGYPGVWAAGRKLASIGLAVRWWITFHGFALNVNTDLSYFKLIKPCGLNPEIMTSMEKLLGRRIELNKVAEKVAQHFAQVMGYDETVYRQCWKNLIKA